MAKRSITRDQRIDGRELYVLDGLLPDDESVALSRALSTMPFRKVEADREGTEMRGFVADFSVDEVREHPLVERMLAQVKRLFPRERFTVERAYCNSNVYGDMSHAHRDASPRRPKDLTAIFYANENWEKDWAGETTFFDDAGDAVACVAPRRGRLALFRGCIEHRNGIPSRECYSPRLTFVLKLRSTARSGAHR
jgi:hypothetical protein